MTDFDTCHRKDTNKPRVKANKFDFTERRYIGRNQIYTEYSMKKIAAVGHRPVCGGKARYTDIRERIFQAIPL